MLHRPHSHYGIVTTLRLGLFLLLVYTLVALPARSDGAVRRSAAPRPTPDSTVEAAADALSQGRPWRATRIITPVLRDTAAPPSPEARMVAARAASAWGGWGEVHRILVGQPWLDSLFEGRGRTLLAHAALALRQDSLAAAQAAAAFAVAPEPGRGRALVLLGRALDRMDLRDSARAAYAGAAELLPDIADWLRLRAAGVTEDPAARAAYYAEVTGPLARTRIGITEALARERAGDSAGAASAYDSAGERIAALRIRLGGADDSTRREARARLLAIVGAGSGDSPGAADLLEAAGTLVPKEALLVARALERASPARAVESYRKAFDGGAGTTDDRFAYAGLLARLGRHAEAAKSFEKVRPPHRLAGRAAYLRVRSLVRGGLIADATPALREVVRRHPKDTVAASTALLLLADLAADRQAETEARAALLELARRYPSSSHAAHARFRAAVIAMATGKIEAAAREFDSLALRYPGSADALGAVYWSGRALARLGDSAGARARWEQVAEREPHSYYAVAASRWLGVEPWAPPAAADSSLPDSSLLAGLHRAALLDSLGLDRESRLEFDALARAADSSPERLLATARAFRDRGHASRAVQLAWRAFREGAARDARLYRLLYPLANQEGLLGESAERGLDPTLVAALIRQESTFDPRATSSAGARGLMQLMPEVGRGLAKALDFPLWDDALLYQPDVSLQLGTAHLAALTRQYDGDPVRLLAAYNAGGSRVDRWSQRTGTDDPELFIERIPYPETRDYVRIILRNRALYRALYPELGRAS